MSTAKRLVHQLTGAARRERPRAGQTREERLYWWGVRFALAVFALGALFPIYFMFVVALTPHSYVWTDIGLVPPLVSLEGFEFALARVDWVQAYAYSLLIAGGSTLLVLLVSIPAAYAFGRLSFPGRRVLFVAVLCIFLFPQQSVALPLYELFVSEIELFGWTLKIYDTPVAIVLPLSTFMLPLAIALLTLFFSGIPTDLEDAARLEGATRIEALWHVVLPLAKPGIASVATLVFIEAYTDHFFTLFMTRGAGGAASTVQANIYYIYNPPWALAYPNALAAAGLIGLIPVVFVVAYLVHNLDSWLAAWNDVTA